MLRIKSALLSLLPLSFLLIGCGIGTTAPGSGSPLTSAGPAYAGKVFGGQQPIKGSHVYLFGVRGDQLGASRSLLGTDGMGNPLVNVDYDNAAGTGVDGSGNRYVITDANGNFSFNSVTAGLNTYLCASNDLVYALAVGGDSGAGTPNSAIMLMADLGPCTGTRLPTTLSINVNEVSTVAAAYALQGFFTDPTHIGWGNSALGQVGIDNASANVAAMVDLGSGAALTKTPNGFGTVPAATINTLANILASCVNTDGSTQSGTTCDTLFANATSNGATDGTKPTETLTAAVNMARFPGKNVSTLFSLQSPTAPFVGLKNTPNDLTLAIAYKPNSLASPGIPAVDGAGNLWFPQTTLSSGVWNMVQVSPLGATNKRYTSTQQPIMAAVDPNGVAWVSTLGGGDVIKIGTFGSSAFHYSSSTSDDAPIIAIDGSGNVFVNDSTIGNVYELDNSGGIVGSHTQAGGGSTQGFHGLALLDANHVLTAHNGVAIESYTSPLTSTSAAVVCGGPYCYQGGLENPTNIAVDGNGIIWALNRNNSISAFQSGSSNGNTGNALTGSAFIGGGLNTTTSSNNQPFPWIAIDGASKAWVANYSGSLSSFNALGNALSPSTGFIGSGVGCKGQGAAVDGSGNIWVSCDSDTAPVLEYIGLATPVYTPLTPGHLGQQP